MTIQRRSFLAPDGVKLSYLIADKTDGRGPLLVLCHGFPGLAYSWRHQLAAAAERGYQAVAPDMRGYGESDAPQAVSQYSLEYIRADILALLGELNAEQAVFGGHDFGAAVAWYMALAAPAQVRGLVVCSVPYDHDYYGRRGLRADASEVLPSVWFAQVAKTQFLHAHYFQQPGIAEAELDEQCAVFLRRLFWALSAKGDLLSSFARADPDAGYLDVLPPVSERLPWLWLSQADFAVFADAFCRRGFRGALNWYRVADINWELNRRFMDANITVPVCFVAGAKDPVLVMSGENAMAFMRSRVPDLRECVVIADAGHWVQQEQPQAVNDVMLRFLQGL